MKREVGTWSGGTFDWSGLEGTELVEKDWWYESMDYCTLYFLHSSF